MPLKHVLQLILASLLWGLGFVASSWSIRTFTSIESVTYRFLIAALLGQLVLFLMTSEKAHFHFKDFIKALPAGILLGLMQLTQTIGLETTTSGKSAFITSLYILFVPLISSLFLKESYKKINYIFCFTANDHSAGIANGRGVRAFHFIPSHERHTNLRRPRNHDQFCADGLFQQT